MEDSLLSLDKATLKNLLQETHKSEHPINTLTSILAYYDVTLEQLQNVCGTLFYAHQVSGDNKHPLKDIVQDILNIQRQDTKISPQAYKIQLVYAATSIPHMWCKEMASVVILDPKESIILPYSHGNITVPFVWIHFNKQCSPNVVQSSRDAPTLKVDLFMYDEPPSSTTFVADNELTISNMLIRIGLTEAIATSNEIKSSNTPDYLLVLTRGNAFYRLANVVLVQPQENKTTKYPTCLHKL